MAPFRDAVLAVALAVASVPGGAAAQTPVGVVDGTLARFDRDTLRPVGPSLAIAEPHAAPVFSRDGARLAVGLSAPSDSGGRIGLWIVDPARMEVAHRVVTGVAVEALAFPGVVAALTQGGALFVVDPADGRVIRRRRVGYSHCGPPAVTVGSTAVFVNQVFGTGVEVTTVSATGAIASRRVPLRVDALAPGCRSVALVADGGRVLVAGERDVASVDVRTLRSRRHAIGDRVAARSAALLPGGLLAVAGERGLRVLDTRSWRTRWRDRRATSVVAAGSTVVGVGRGVRARRAGTGRLLWRARASSRSIAAVAAGRVYLQSSGPIRILDLGTGRRTGTHPWLSMTLDFAAPSSG